MPSIWLGQTNLGHPHVCLVQLAAEPSTAKLLCNQQSSPCTCERVEENRLCGVRHLHKLQATESTFLCRPRLLGSVVSMGIDIFFTDESLSNCGYALCAQQRKTPVEVTYNETNTGVPYWELRRVRRSDFRHTDVALPAEDPAFAYEYKMQKVGEEYPSGLPDEITGDLRRLILEQSKRNVLLKTFVRWVGAQEFSDLVDYCTRHPDDDKFSLETAWYGHLAWDERRNACRQCPVAPLDEEDCSLRFSNYPGMDYFKEGMTYLISYAEKYKRKNVDLGPFSYPHLSREKNETPRDKVVELWGYCAGTEINRTSEHFFNAVFGALDSAIGPSKKRKKGLTTIGHRVSTDYIPFVDEFLASASTDAMSTSLKKRKNSCLFLRQSTKWRITQDTKLERVQKFTRSMPFKVG